MKKIKFIKEYKSFSTIDPLSNASDNLDFVRTFTVGEVVDRVPEVSAQWLIDNGFAEKAKESGWWKPELGDKYYFVDNNGYIEASWYDGGVVDADRLAIGNCFKTKDAAERYRDYLKAITTVRQDEGVLTPEQICDVFTNSTQGAFVVANDVTGRRLYITGTRLIHPGDVCFDTEAHALVSLDKHPDEWETIANYDWSRE